MVQPVPEKRPTAEQLIQILQPNGPDVPEDVFGYIEQYRYNNKILEQKVEVSQCCYESINNLFNLLNKMRR